MSPTPWLDSWLGHVSADMSPHDCPAISMTHVAITPMDIMVVFKKNMVRIHDIMYTLPYSHFCALNHTITVQFSAKFCFFLLCPKDLAYMSAKSWMMSCRHVIWQVRPIFFPMLDQHSRHFADMTTCVGMTCHLGGVGNMTWCRHFQLRNILNYCYQWALHVLRYLPSQDVWANGNPWVR